MLVTMATIQNSLSRINEILFRVNAERFRAERVSLVRHLRAGGLHQHPLRWVFYKNYNTQTEHQEFR